MSNISFDLRDITRRTQASSYHRYAVFLTILGTHMSKTFFFLILFVLKKRHLPVSSCSGEETSVIGCCCDFPGEVWLARVSGCILWFSVTQVLQALEAEAAAAQLERPQAIPSGSDSGSGGHMLQQPAAMTSSPSSCSSRRSEVTAVLERVLSLEGEREVESLLHHICEIPEPEIETEEVA